MASTKIAILAVMLVCATAQSNDLESNPLIQDRPDFGCELDSVSGVFPGYTTSVCTTDSECAAGEYCTFNGFRLTADGARGDECSFTCLPLTVVENPVVKINFTVENFPEVSDDTTRRLKRAAIWNELERLFTGSVNFAGVVDVAFSDATAAGDVSIAITFAVAAVGDEAVIDMHAADNLGAKFRSAYKGDAAARVIAGLSIKLANPFLSDQYFFYITFHTEGVEETVLYTEHCQLQTHRKFCNTGTCDSSFSLTAGYQASCTCAGYLGSLCEISPVEYFYLDFVLDINFGGQLLSMGSPKSKQFQVAVSNYLWSLLDIDTDADDVELVRVKESISTISIMKYTRVGTRTKVTLTKKKKVPTATLR